MMTFLTYCIIVIFLPALVFFIGTLGLGNLFFVFAVYVFEKRSKNQYLFIILILMSLLLDVMFHAMLGSHLISVSVGLLLCMLLFKYLPTGNIYFAVVVRVISFFLMHFILVRFLHGISLGLSIGILFHMFLYAFFDVLWLGLIKFAVPLFVREDGQVIRL